MLGDCRLISEGFSDTDRLWYMTRTKTNNDKKAIINELSRQIIAGEIEAKHLKTAHTVIQGVIDLENIVQFQELE